MKEENNTYIQEPRRLFTLLGDVVEALLLNGLVIYEALDFGGGAVHVRVLEGKQHKTITNGPSNSYDRELGPHLEKKKVFILREKL